MQHRLRCPWRSPSPTDNRCLWHSLCLSDEGCTVMRRLLEFKCKALCVVDCETTGGCGCSLVPAALASDPPDVPAARAEAEDALFLGAALQRLHDERDAAAMLTPRPPPQSARGARPTSSVRHRRVMSARVARECA